MHVRQIPVPALRRYEIRHFENMQRRYVFLKRLERAIGSPEALSMQQIAAQMDIALSALRRWLRSQPDLEKLYVRYRYFALAKTRE